MTRSLLVPLVSLALLAGPALAQDAAPQPAAAPEYTPPPNATLTDGQRQEMRSMDNTVVADRAPDHEWGGSSVTFGGGGFLYTAGDTRDITNTGGSWDLRFTFGTRLPVALELAYIGGLTDIDTVGIPDEALLLGNGAEAAVRWNILPDEALQPYVMTGIAFRHYELVRQQFNTSIVGEDDNVYEVPVGIGFALRYRAMVVDLRFQYRHAFDNELFTLTAATMGDEYELHTADAQLKVGFEF